MRNLVRMLVNLGKAKEKKKKKATKAYLDRRQRRSVSDVEIK
jgi:hypothetical protein